MKVVIYESNTGFTKQYAEMIAKETGAKVFALQDAKNNVTKTDEVFFMGWLFGSKIQGLKKALRKFNVVSVASIGVTYPSGEYSKELIRSNKINDIKFYYLQGGLDKSKLKGFKLKLINLLAKSLEKDYEQGKLKKEDKEGLKIFKNGANFVKPENIAKIVREW